MDNREAEQLTSIGKMIKISEIPFNCIIENTGIYRGRLIKLMTKKDEELSFKEGVLLAETLKIPIGEFVAYLKEDSLKDKWF